MANQCKHVNKPQLVSVGALKRLSPLPVPLSLIITQQMAADT